MRNGPGARIAAWKVWSMRRSLPVAALVLICSAVAMGQELLPAVQRKPASQLPSNAPADCDDGAVSAAVMAALPPVIATLPASTAELPRRAPSRSTASLLSALQQTAAGSRYEPFAAALQAVRDALPELPPGERATVQRVLPVYDDLQELWSYEQANAIGAFYDDASLPGMHAHLVSRYRGYAAYISDFQITADDGRKFYPTAETRKFLVREAAKGTGVKTPAPLSAGASAHPPSGSARPRVASKTATPSTSKAVEKPAVSKPVRASSAHAPAPKTAAPRIAAASPKKVEPAPAAPKKVAAPPVASPIKPAKTAEPPAKVAATPAPKPAAPAATASVAPPKSASAPATITSAPAAAPPATAAGSPPPSGTTATPAAPSVVTTASTAPPAAATAPSSLATAPTTSSAEPPTSAPATQPPVSTQTAVSALPPQQNSSRLIFFVILGLISLGALVAMIRATRETPAPPEVKPAPPPAGESEPQKVYPLQSGTRKKK
jgi:hypothetical protein